MSSAVLVHTEIRPATAEDLDAIAAMGEAFVGSTTYDKTIPRDASHLRRSAETVLSLAPAGRIFLGLVDGRPEGMLLAFVFPHFITGLVTASEQAWWVNPDARGTGIGRQLLAAFEAWARSQGATRTELGSRDKVLDRFYRSLGYRAMERIFVKDLAP